MFGWAGMKQGSKVFAQGTKWMMGSLSEGNVRRPIEGPLKRKEDQVLVMDLRMGGNGILLTAPWNFLKVL